MAPPSVLLDRVVKFLVPEGAEETRSDRRAGKQPVVLCPMKGRTTEEGADDMLAKIEAMKPEVHLFDPPEISSVSMVNQKGVNLRGGVISTTDKSLAVLYMGQYRPGYARLAASGCYMVYDASKNSVCAIPQVPDPHTFRGLGKGAAILSLENGSYLLAEIVKAKSGFPEAELFLWKSPNSNQWIRRKVCLPREFSPGFVFRIEMVFVHTQSRICWVDLFRGVLVADQIESPEPEFTFISLPAVCSIGFKGRPYSKEFRTMGSVCGEIKFVALLGYYEGWPCDQVTLKTWTLSHDKGWEITAELCVKDLWKDKSFLNGSLPMRTASFPVLSFNEPDVLYVLLNEVEEVDAVDTFGKVCGVHIVHKAHYVLRLDTVQNKVLSHTKVVAPSPGFPNLLSSEFGGPLLTSKDHQATSEAGASWEQIKHADEAEPSKKRTKLGSSSYLP